MKKFLVPTAACLIFVGIMLELSLPYISNLYYYDLQRIRENLNKGESVSRLLIGDSTIIHLRDNFQENTDIAVMSSRGPFAPDLFYLLRQALASFPNLKEVYIVSHGSHILEIDKLREKSIHKRFMSTFELMQNLKQTSQLASFSFFQHILAKAFNFYLFSYDFKFQILRQFPADLELKEAMDTRHASFYAGKSTANSKHVFINKAKKLLDRHKINAYFIQSPMSSTLRNMQTPINTKKAADTIGLPYIDLSALFSDENFLSDGVHLEWDAKIWQLFSKKLLGILDDPGSYMRTTEETVR